MSVEEEVMHIYSEFCKNYSSVIMIKLDFKRYRYKCRLEGIVGFSTGNSPSKERGAVDCENNPSHIVIYAHSEVIL